MVCYDWFVADGGSLALGYFSKGEMPKAPLPNLGETSLDRIGLFPWS